MRIVVASDFHFGDKDCVLVEKVNNEWALRSGVAERLQALAGIDLLILPGDVFDFTVSHYPEAFAASRPFFDFLKAIGVQQILYSPGNHDLMLWHALDYETRVTRSLGDPCQRVAKPLRVVLPAIVRPDAGTVELPGVTNPGETFLKGFTGIPWLVAYPNIYVATKDSTVLLTHGQYFEGWWAFGGEITQAAASDDLHLHEGLSLKQTVDFNHPLSQLSCTGIGQAGELTELARLIRQEIMTQTTGEGTYVHRYLGPVKEKLDEMIKFEGAFGWLKELGSDLALCVAARWAKKKLRQVKPTRNNPSWLDDPDVARRFGAFFQVCLADIGSRNRSGAEPIPKPTKVVLGHTHVPEDWKEYTTLVNGEKISVCNTGGWLTRAQAKLLIWDHGVFNYQSVW
jgi:UDP-2,3-diacylglucosamine pyrophosphatase LpxH